MSRTSKLLRNERERVAGKSGTFPSSSAVAPVEYSRTRRLLEKQGVKPTKDKIPSPSFTAETSPTVKKASRAVSMLEGKYDQAKSEYRKTQVGQQPYAMGRDSFTPSSPYAAGLQARQAWERPKSTQPDTTLPSFPQRVMDTVSGGLKGTGASMTNMFGTLREMGQKSRDKENQAMIEDYARGLEEAQAWLNAALEDVAKDPKSWTQDDIQGFYNMRDDAQLKYDAVAKVYGKENQEKTIQGTYEAADKLQLSSAQDIERAKEGLGVPGQMLVDAGVGMTQMAGDAVGAALTGSGMIPLVMRAFGGGAQQARQDGADLKGQVGYGAAVAAKEYVTEKMFGIALPFSRIYGGGAVDDAVERVIQKTVEKLASTPWGQRAVGGLLTMFASGGTEGLEEFFGNWLEWQMPRIYGGNVDTAAETLLSSLYDFVVGGITGLAGGAVSLGRYIPQGMDEETHSRLTQVAKEMYDADQTQKTAPVEGAGGVWVGRATLTQHPYDGATPTYIKPEAKMRPKIMGESVAAAQMRIELAKQQEQQAGKSFRSFLNKVYETIFLEKGGSRGVVVDGLSMNDEPYVVAVNKSAIGKVISDINVSAEKLAVIEAIDDVIQNGEYVGSGKYIQKGKRKHTIRFDYFETPVEIGGRPFLVTFDVEVFPSTNNYRTHKVINEMDLIPQNRADTGTHPPQGPIRTDPSIEIVSQVGDSVKHPSGYASSVSAETLTADQTEYAPGGGMDILKETALQMSARSKKPLWQKRNMETIRRAASTFGPVGAQKLQEFYQGSSQAPEEYFGGFAVYYHAGLTGQDIMTVQGDHADAINYAQAEAAYLAGQLDAAESLKTEKSSITAENNNVPFTSEAPDDIIEIGRSLGAKAANYDVMDLETGEIFHFVEGTKLQNVQVFAGKGSWTVFRKAAKYADRFGGAPKDWQHVKGFGLLATSDGDRKAEVHWIQCEGVGKFDFFIKEWLD